MFLQTWARPSVPTFLKKTVACSPPPLRASDTIDLHLRCWVSRSTSFSLHGSWQTWRSCTLERYSAASNFLDWSFHINHPNHNRCLSGTSVLIWQLSNMNLNRAEQKPGSDRRSACGVNGLHIAPCHTCQSSFQKYEMYFWRQILPYFKTNINQQLICSAWVVPAVLSFTSALSNEEEEAAWSLRGETQNIWTRLLLHLPLFLQFLAKSSEWDWEETDKSF